MLSLVRVGVPSYARPPPSLLGVMIGTGHASCECRVLKRVEDVKDDPGLGSLPTLLGFRWASVIRAFVSHCVVGRMAYCQ